MIHLDHTRRPLSATHARDSQGLQIVIHHGELREGGFSWRQLEHGPDFCLISINASTNSCRKVQPPQRRRLPHLIPRPVGRRANFCLGRMGDCDAGRRRNRHKEGGCTGKRGGSSTFPDLSLRYLWIDAASQDIAVGVRTCVIRSSFHCPST